MSSQVTLRNRQKDGSHVFTKDSYAFDGEVFIFEGIPPRKWDHYLSNGEYGMKVNSSGEAFSISGKNYHILVNPPFTGFTPGGKFVYVKDTTSGEIFSPSLSPVGKKPDKYRIEFSPYWAVFESVFERKNASPLKLRLLFSVLPDIRAEMWELGIEGDGSYDVYFSNLWSGYPSPNMDFVYHYWFTGSEYRREDNSVIFFFNEAYNRMERLRFFMKPDFHPDGVFTTYPGFVGNGSLSAPEMALKGVHLFEGPSGGDIALTTFSKKVNGSASLRVFVGDARYLKDILRYESMGLEDIAGALRARQSLDLPLVETPSRKFNTIFHPWTKFQIWHQGAGHVRLFRKGYRDTLQDAMFLSEIQPDKAREIIVKACASQYHDGKAIRQWGASMLGDDTRIYNDSPLWLVYAVRKYLDETGDVEFLLEETPFYDRSYEKTQIVHHALMGLLWVLDRKGEHSLIKVGKGDWNDALNLMGAEGRGESVWLSLATVLALKEMLHVLDILGRAGVSQKLRFSLEEALDRLNNELKTLEDSLTLYGWDGDRWIRGYSDRGVAVGSREEGRVFLMPQAWSVMAGVKSSYWDTMVETVKKYLYTDYGVMLFYPYYEDFDSNVGRLSMLVPGRGENGVVYNNASAWWAYALYLMGRRQEAFEVLEKLIPATHSLEKIKSEPFSFVNFYRIFPESRRGEGGLPWLTSTVTWFYFSLMEGLFGVRVKYDKVVVVPGLPKEWGEAVLIRPVREKPVKFVFKNKKPLPEGEQRIIVRSGSFHKEFMGFAEIRTDELSDEVVVEVV